MTVESGVSTAPTFGVRAEQCDSWFQDVGPTLFEGPVRIRRTTMAAETGQKAEHMGILWDYLAKTYATGTAPASNGLVGRPEVLMSGKTEGSPTRAGAEPETPSSRSPHPPASASTGDRAAVMHALIAYAASHRQLLRFLIRCPSTS